MLLKAVYKKNVRQQQRKVTWALAELFNTLWSPWLSAYTLYQPVWEYKYTPRELSCSTAGSASGVVSVYFTNVSPNE